MEDRRIAKTKRELKRALISLLADKPFEKITVTELCAAANTGRITFYAHYSDKYELVDELCRDFQEQAAEDYARLQRENNPRNEPVASYCNLLDAIMNLYYDRIDFFSHTHPEESPYLYFSVYRYILRTVEAHTEHRTGVLRPLYSTGQLTSFLCNGLWGFINTCHREKCPLEEVRAKTKALLRRVLESGILLESR